MEETKGTFLFCHSFVIVLYSNALTLGMVGRNEWIRIQQVPLDEVFE